MVGDLLGPQRDALGLGVDRYPLALQRRERLVALSAALAERLGTELERDPASADALRDHVSSGAVVGSGGTTGFAVATRIARTDAVGFVLVAAVASRACR